MKSLSLIIFIFTLAQNICAQNFNAGIISGISTTQVSGDNLAGFHKAGLILGGFVNRNINNQMELQIEMTFTQKGSVNQKKDKLPQIADINLNYLEFPILFKFVQSNNISIELGLQTAALIEGYYSDLYGKLENQIEFNKIEIGGLIGFSYLLTRKISLNTRLSNSLLPIAPHASGQTYNLNKGKYNTGLNFSLQYQF